TRAELARTHPGIRGDTPSRRPRRCPSGLSCRNRGPAAHLRAPERDRRAGRHRRLSEEPCMSITTVRRPPTPAAAGRLDILVGAGAALLTVAIWSLWLVGTRAAMGERLPLPILGLCRYGIPALVLAPL